MTGQHHVVVALCESAASRWAAGDLRTADRLFVAALELCRGQDFIDLDDEASR